MFCMIYFSNAETDYMTNLHKVLNIEASPDEINEIYQLAFKKPLDIPTDLGLSSVCSTSRYEMFLNALNDRKIKFNEFESCMMVF